MTAVLFYSGLWPEQKKIQLAIWMHDDERKKSVNLFAPSANNLTDNFFFVGMIEPLCILAANFYVSLVPPPFATSLPNEIHYIPKIDSR